MSTPYLDLTGLKSLSLMPSGDLDNIETVQPGWIASQLVFWSRWMDARLSKRYAVPFAAPYPEAVTGWLARLVTIRCALKRGIDPLDVQFTVLKTDAETAQAEILEAANSETGLYELPLLATSSASGVSKGGPYAYTETSPYVGRSVQQQAGTLEDQSNPPSGTNP